MPACFIPCGSEALDKTRELQSLSRVWETIGFSQEDDALHSLRTCPHSGFWGFPPKCTTSSIPPFHILSFLFSTLARNVIGTFYFCLLHFLISPPPPSSFCCAPITSWGFSCHCLPTNTPVHTDHMVGLTTWLGRGDPHPWGQLPSLWQSCSVSCLICKKSWSPFSHLSRNLLWKKLQNIIADSSFTPFIIHCMDPTRLEAGFRLSSVNTSETLDQMLHWYFTGPQLEKLTSKGVSSPKIIPPSPLVRWHHKTYRASSQRAPASFTPPLYRAWTWTSFDTW